MRRKTIKIVVLVCLMITIIITSIFMSLNTGLDVAEAAVIADDASINLQTAFNGMFDRETTSTEYLYNLDGSADYIYVEFNGGGYAVLYRDTYELLELSYTGTLYSGVGNVKKYYGGPSNYYTKDSTGFKKYHN